jgi:predicted TIM-barrel fold metal-dependent hydrolase
MSRNLPGPVLDFHVRLAPGGTAVARLRAVLDECGIDRAVVCAGGTIDLDRLSTQVITGGHVETDPDNDAVLAACADSGGRLLPYYFASPHADPGEYRARGGDFLGLEISPAVHGVPLCDARVMRLVAIAAVLGHSVYIVCLQRSGCGVDVFTTLAATFPGVRFVLGHSGVGNIDYHGLNLIQPYPNITLETSGGYSGVLRAALDRLGAHRVVFGSEHPLQHPDVELAKYRAIGIDEPSWRAVAWHNGHELLNLERSPT